MGRRGPRPDPLRALGISRKLAFNARALAEIGQHAPDLWDDVLQRRVSMRHAIDCWALAKRLARVPEDNS
jgi:hypothetical protein